jgi:SlyX protein
MNDAEPVDTRIEQLETRIAYQDHTIEELNKSVTEQWRQIEALGKQVERMAARLLQIEDNAAPRAAEPPPPHY